MTAELAKAKKKLAFQHEQITKLSAKLSIADKELAFQKKEKAKRASELVELVLKNKEIAQQATELRINAINAANYEKKIQASFMETIGIARLLVELRDPYTAGHQEHVGDLAKAIAADLGFDAHYQEDIMIAGYLHDIGKIIVPIEILSKPGKLTEEEFNLVKNHVQAGHEILNGLTFNQDITNGVREHHERLDGSGYPRSLKGDEISINGRILAVADVVDAMSSHRPYRASLGIEKALDEIMRGRNTLYDATVVDVCLKLFQEKSYKIAPEPPYIYGYAPIKK